MPELPEVEVVKQSLDKNRAKNQKASKKQKFNKSS